MPKLQDNESIILTYLDLNNANIELAKIVKSSWAWLYKSATE